MEQSSPNPSGYSSFAYLPRRARSMRTRRLLARSDRSGTTSQSPRAMAYGKAIHTHSGIWTPLDGMCRGSPGEKRDLIVAGSCASHGTADMGPRTERVHPGRLKAPARRLEARCQHGTPFASNGVQPLYCVSPYLRFRCFVTWSGRDAATLLDRSACACFLSAARTWSIVVYVTRPCRMWGMP